MADPTAVHDPAITAQSQVGMVLGVAITFVTISSLVVGLRLYTRCGILKTAGLDDWTMCMALALAIVASISTSLEGVNGLGRHSWVVSPEQSIEQLKFLYTTILVYNMGMNVVKVSFLLQYRRIFQSEWTRRICIWMIGYVIVWAVVQDVVLGLSCLPIAFIVPTTATFCLPTLPIWYFSSAMSLVTDFVIFLIPLPSVIKLQLPQRQKILVYCIFCLGFFVCAISLIRIFTLKGAVNSTDPSWDGSGAAAWSIVELNCAILCSSLPTIRPLLSRVLPGFGSSFKSRTGYGHQGSAYTNSENFKRRTKSKEQSGSTEELALGTMTGRDNTTGVYAVCSADNRSEEGSLETGYEPGRKSQNRIMVKTETMMDGHVIQPQQWRS